MNREIIIASGNNGKCAEIRQVLSGLPFLLRPLGDYFSPLPRIPEEGATFLENARAKAQWVFSRIAAMCIADDSGLEVDFLDGQPGVHSARFAGEPASDQKNVEKLLSLLKRCPPERRAGRFRCVIVLKLSRQEEIIAEGTCEGTIGFAPQGNNGFGYDPIFVPQGFDKTFAQLDAAAKNAISHRGKALSLLKEKAYARYPIPQ